MRRGWYAMGEPGRAFGARAMVSFSSSSAELDDALLLGITLGAGFRFYQHMAERGYIQRWPAFRARLQEELRRRLGGRALDRALALL